MAMDRMSFTIPPDLKRRAQAIPDMNWSAVVAKAIQQRVELWERLEEFARRSTLTQKDVDEMAEKIDRAMAQGHRKLRASSSTPTES